MSLEWKACASVYTVNGGGEVLHKLIGLAQGPTNPSGSMIFSAMS